VALKMVLYCTGSLGKIGYTCSLLNPNRSSTAVLLGEARVRLKSFGQEVVLGITPLDVDQFVYTIGANPVSVISAHKTFTIGEGTEAWM